MSRNMTTLDVREDIRAGREPFSKIMAAVAGLSSEENLLIIAPFEPVPLFHLLAKQGFSHESKQTFEGDWQVMFSRQGAGDATTFAVQAKANDSGCESAQLAEVVNLDARGLEPPQPLVAILEAISTLPPGGVLRAQTDRRPMHL
jgi:uncharacterized protein (DUF2249 family)